MIKFLITQIKLNRISMDEIPNKYQELVKIELEKEANIINE